MIPKTIRVLGKPIKILVVEKSGVSEDTLGAYIDVKQEIELRKNLPLETEQDTLLHEILHAVDSAMGTKCSERQVGALATGILSVLKDNPDFLKYLGTNGK